MEIQIRRSEKSDIEAIKAIYQQHLCYAGTLQLPFPSLDKWLQFLGNLPADFYSLVAEVDGEIVGQLGMKIEDNPRRRHVANIGMAVSENFQSKGVGSKLLTGAVELATNWLAIKRIELEVYTDNKAGIALYQKHGFEIEGTAKGYAFRDGNYVDAHLMARTRL